MNDFKKRIFDIIQIGKENDFASKAFDVGIVITIIVNISIMFFQTYDELAQYQGLMGTIELVTVLIFCLEYFLRIWTASYLYPDSKRMTAVFRFVTSFDGIVDLCTILPFFYLSGFIAFRMLRVVRILHLFRINSNYDSINVIKTVFIDKKNQLFSSMFIIMILMCASSLCMYSAEHEAQPEAFSNAFSGIWWSMSTILTVGYGDVYPITMAGRLMAIVIAFLGVGVVAIPTGIISAGFVEQYSNAQNKSKGGVVLGETVQTIYVDIDSNWIGASAKEISKNSTVLTLSWLRGEINISCLMGIIMWNMRIRWPW